MMKNVAAKYFKLQVSLATYWALSFVQIHIKCIFARISRFKEMIVLWNGLIENYTYHYFIQLTPSGLHRIHYLKLSPTKLLLEVS